MSLTYGYDLNDGDEFMEAPAQAIELMSPLFLPGAVLVNYLPFCTVPYFITPMLASHSFFTVRRIHSWVPFINYEPLIQKGKKLSEIIKNGPIDFVKSVMVCCDHAPTLYSDRPCYSMTAQLFSHWRASIYKS